jgi:hypothetical protein
MTFARIIVVSLTCLAAVLPIAGAGPLDPARFWISESATNPGNPHAPEIIAVTGQPRTLYIWARPATDANGAFRKLEGFSLDVVTLLGPTVVLDQFGFPVPEPQPFIDFLDGTFRVDNPTEIGVHKRFQFTTDCCRPEAQGGPLASALTRENITSDNADAIFGLQGLSPLANPSTVGIGNGSDPFPYRVGTGNEAAWRVGQFSFEALPPTGTNHNYLFLQIGWFGMRHNGAEPTQVVFGDDESPVYTAGPGANHRQTTLQDDTFDVQINLAFAAADYNRDYSVGQPDFLYWKETFGQSVSPGDGADGNRNGRVDAADYVVWRKAIVPPSIVTLPSAGDYNRDCTVGQADFLLWKSSFGQMVSPPGAGADGNRNGKVDAADYVIWRKMLEVAGDGVVLSGDLNEGNSRAAVPEPASASLASLLMFLMSLRYHRGRE